MKTYEKRTREYQHETGCSCDIASTEWRCVSRAVRIESEHLHEYLVKFDVETHAIKPGLMAGQP